MGRELDREVSTISVGEIEESLSQSQKQIDEAAHTDGIEEEVEIPTPSGLELSDEETTQVEPALLELGSPEETFTIIESLELEGVEQPEPTSAVEPPEGEVGETLVAHLTQDDLGEMESAPVETPSPEDTDFTASMAETLEIAEPVYEPQFPQPELPDDTGEFALVHEDIDEYSPEVRLAEPLDLDLDYAAEFEGVQPLELDGAVPEPAQVSDLADLQELAGEQHFASVPPEEIEVPDIELPRSDHEELLQYAKSGRVRSPAERFQDFQPRNLVSVPDIA